MTDPDQTIIFSPNGASNNGQFLPGEYNGSFPVAGGSALPQRFGADDDLDAADIRSPEFSPGLVSLGFITAAIRRRALFLSIMTIVGLAVGAGFYKAFPGEHEYRATASLLLTLSPYESSQTAANDNEAMAETYPVAEIAVHELGLRQSVSSFMTTYSAISITERVLQITASAPSSAEASQRASAVGSAFLKFRADELQAEQNLVLGSLDQQISVAKQRLDSLDARLTSVLPSQVGKLQAERTSVKSTLSGLEQALTANQTSTQPDLAAALRGSQVLSVTPASRSLLKSIISYALIGLVGGLILGLIIVVIGALVSDRLRQRDDVAYALGAPVRLSVGTLRARSWLPAIPGRSARQDRDLNRLIGYLRNAVPGKSRGPAGLAIISVDNASAVAGAVAATASSLASQGHQVVVADLSSGAPLAHMLGVSRHGAHQVNRNGVSFMAAVPDRDDIAPVGPLRAGRYSTAPAPAEGTLGALCGAADVLLTLATPDPGLGADYLATWATSAVVMVTAGQSSTDRVRGVGEMVRLAGLQLDSVVLIGADENDESLGVAREGATA